MCEKLTKTDREKILASRTGELPMAAIDQMLLSMWKRQKELQKEAEVKKQKATKSNK